MRPYAHLLSYLAAFLCLGCAANKDSYYQKGEIVDIRLNQAPEAAVIGAGLAVVAPVLIDYGIGSLKRVLAKEANKYTAAYGNEINDSHFYKNVSGIAHSLNYESVTLTRKVGIEGSQTTVSQITIKFSTDGSGTFLSLQPLNIKIDKSKAKLRRNDNTLDLVLQVQMISYWIDRDQQYHAEETANIAIPVYNIELGRSYGPQDEELSKNSKWFLPVPLSHREDGQVFGNGTFSLVVTVTELDDFGKRIGSISDLVHTNEAALKDWLLQLLEK
ncbi:hypothetical protein K8352_11635 [Flavobacteriaceae bacterium F89]|uniref:Lipoprotein n=1 Tax=Cerina litoralis TaxID=2874477 RepID=A0AAE3EW73_9FLAO|nr:hypothetical protein [Cerina litoralis]MCG2461403.1 hypothetical protein [Cerina litoralis]